MTNHDHSHEHEHEHEHSQTHEHSHSHSQTHDHGEEMTLEQKLTTLLSHWIDHNDSHKDNYLSWAGKAKEGGLTDIASFLDQAGSLSQDVTHKLEDALKQIKS